MTIELLKRFLEAFNHHDLDSIMGYFAEDCVFYSRAARHRAAIGMSGRTRCEQAWQNALREFQMYITEKISTGCVMISEFPNGH